jgi:hypothetical protein
LVPILGVQQHHQTEFPARLKGHQQNQAEVSFGWQNAASPPKQKIWTSVDILQ